MQSIDLSGNYVTTNTFQLWAALNGMDFKFVTHGLLSDKQNILLQHIHKKEFWILTNKCEIILNMKTRLGGHGYSASFSCLRLSLYLLVKIQNSFYACVEEGRSASLTIAREKQT